MKDIKSIKLGFSKSFKTDVNENYVGIDCSHNQTLRIDVKDGNFNTFLDKPYNYANFHSIKKIRVGKTSVLGCNDSHTRKIEIETESGWFELTLFAKDADNLKFKRRLK